MTDITIKNVLTDGIYNDLGFLLGEKFMILLEAQSLCKSLHKACTPTDILWTIVEYTLILEYFRKSKYNKKYKRI